MVSNVGTDPITLSGLLEAFAKQGGATVNGNQLTNGIITDGYLPPLGDTSNSWIALFKKVHDQYDPKAPFDGNVALRRGRRLHVRAGDAQGGQEPDPGGPGVGDPGRAPAGSRGRPVRLLRDRPLGHHRRLHGVIQNGVLVQQGSVLTTDTSASGPITTYTGTEQQAPASGIPSP